MIFFFFFTCLWCVCVCDRISCARVMMEYLCVLPSVPSREQLEADLHLGPGDLHLIASLLQGSRRWPLA